MEEIKTKAIVLSSKDYKEKDKLVNLFSLELGNITATLKGCKSPTSKLRFAYQPICFADYLIGKQNGHYMIINCTLLESFFDIVNNPSDYMQSSLMLEIVQNLKYIEEYQKVFIELLYSLKAICYDKVNCKLVCEKFMLNILKTLGFSFNFKCCMQCKLPFINNIYLNLDSGALLCHNCNNMEDLLVSKNELANMRIIDSCEYSRLNTIKIKQEVLDSILKLTLLDLEERLLLKLKSRQYLIN